MLSDDMAGTARRCVPLPKQKGEVMKKEKTALWAVVLLIAMTGCGNETEQLVESTDVIVEPLEKEENERSEGADTRDEESSQDETSQNENEAVSQDETSQDNETPSGESSENETFEGSVRSINEKDNFVVVSEIFTEELDDGSMLAVDVVGVGSDEENLITVYFTENTNFQVKTVVNAGESVTEKEGTFSDIKEKSTLEFEGKMDAEGKEFLADNVVIYEFIYT